MPFYVVYVTMCTELTEVGIETLRQNTQETTLRYSGKNTQNGRFQAGQTSVEIQTIGHRCVGWRIFEDGTGRALPMSCRDDDDNES